MCQCYQVKGFAPRQRIGLLLDMEERSLDYYLDGVKVIYAVYMHRWETFL